MQVINC